MSLRKHHAIRVVSAATMNDPRARGGTARRRASRMGMGFAGLRNILCLRQLRIQLRRGPLIFRMEHMGSTSDKASGLANQAAGKVKEGLGKATGDAKLETEGAAQDAKGKVQKGIGDAKGAIKDAVNKNL